MSKIAVTDHAMMRFLARAGGLDVETLRAQISSSLQRAATAANALAASRYTIKVDGLIFVIVDGVCVSVIGRETGGGAP